MDLRDKVEADNVGTSHPSISIFIKSTFVMAFSWIKVSNVMDDDVTLSETNALTMVILSFQGSNVAFKALIHSLSYSKR